MELKKEAAGRLLPVNASEERRASHPGIGIAIDLARQGLSAATGLTWGISRDSHYQISNRFAWCWKVASLGIPVVLIYLGFIGAGEMSDKGAPFADANAWNALVLEHSREIVPAEAWERHWFIQGVPLVALIRSLSLCDFRDLRKQTGRAT